MVRLKIDPHVRSIQLSATVVTYGNASNGEITRQIAEEIEGMWNEPMVSVELDGRSYSLTFRIGHLWRPDIDPTEILANTDPALNFYRIEEYAQGNISFVDGLGSNTGYFKLENLYAGSTTAAHEFGHGLGLDHPLMLDIRGMGRPGIMYPRGTWVDPAYQYDPAAAPGAPGGTMHPRYRRVMPDDIENLGLERLLSRPGAEYVGAFTSVYHNDHSGADMV
jgi:hypothetical protein